MSTADNNITRYGEIHLESEITTSSLVENKHEEDKNGWKHQSIEKPERSERWAKRRNSCVQVKCDARHQQRYSDTISGVENADVVIVAVVASHPKKIKKKVCLS